MAISRKSGANIVTKSISTCSLIHVYFALINTFTSRVMTISTFFIRGNIFVALCAASLTWETLLLFGIDEQLITIPIIFFSTLFVYNFHRLMKANELTAEINSSGLIKQTRLLKYMMTISSIFLIPLLYFTSIPRLIIFCLSGFIALWYRTGFFKKKGQWFTLRNIPFLKLFLIALMWAVMTVSFPLANEYSSLKYWFLFAERFVFILAITIPFDIRDMAIDQSQGLKTLPLLWGIQNMKKLAQTFVLIFIVIIIVGYFISQHSFNQTLALIISGVITFYFIGKVKMDNEPYFFSVGMEGVSLIQALLVGISYLIQT